MRRTALFAGLATICAAASFVGTRALTRKEAPPREECSLDCFQHGLALTSDQRRQCAARDKTFERRQAALMNTHAARQADLMALLRQPRPDRAEIDRALVAISETQTQLQQAVVDHLLALKPILSSQQQEELFESLGRQMCGRLALEVDLSSDAQDDCGLHERPPCPMPEMDHGADQSQ